MKIPFSDLGLLHKKIKRDLDSAMEKVVKRGDFILGEDVTLLEKEFASYCNTRFAVGVSSGTAALFLGLLSEGVGENDEVIVPAFTFIATALAVSYVGAKPVFVDIDEKTYCLDVKKIEQAITKKTKAIIVVHLFGQPADMITILRLARKHNLKVIEDAAQAHGALVKMPGNRWKKAGGIGDIGCFSFYPSKNLGALGDAGMLVTNDEAVYKKLLVLRDCGRVSKYEHAIIGYNSRLDTLQAAVLRVKLKQLNRWNKMRQQAAYFYNRCLKDIDGIILPYSADNIKHTYHVYSIRIKNRDKVFEQLRKKGIGAIIHYPIPLHLQKAYKHLGHKKGDFPVSEKISSEIMSLPIFPYITEAQIKYVAAQIAVSCNRGGSNVS